MLHTPARVTSLLLTVALGVTGLTTVAPIGPAIGSTTGTAAVAARRATEIRIAPARPIAGERAVVSGSLPGARRPVTLQRDTGKGFKVIASGRSTGQGGFRFTTAASTTPTLRYRVVAPQQGATPPARTRALTVARARQTARLTGPRTAAVGRSFAVGATFTPARKGRRVLVQSRSGNRWTTVASGSQSPAGKATVTVKPTRAGVTTYRALTAAYRGAPAKAGGSLRVDVKGAGAGSITRESVSSAEAQGNGLAGRPSISGDGRYVAFDSLASNLVPGDKNNEIDVFVRDLQKGTTTLVSHVPGGTATADDSSQSPKISSDGRYVAYLSDASNLVTGESSTLRTAYRWDRTTGKSTRVSAAFADGGPANGYIESIDISDDGRFVAFGTEASNLVAGDSNTFFDIFVRDMDTATTTRVSVSTAAAQGDDNAFDATLSATGRFVTFQSFAGNLVAGDTNGEADVFVHDRVTATTTRVSVSSAGAQGNDFSYVGGISADGRYVVYESKSSTLVSGDTNQSKDAFLFDRTTGKTTRLSLAPGGKQANDRTEEADISADGRFVVLRSEATNLVSGDTFNKEDVFVRNRVTGATSRVTVSASGTQGDEDACCGALSNDGGLLVFATSAGNLVAGDTNDVVDVFVRRLG